MTEEITVRIVDDEPEMRDSLSFLLESVGLKVKAYQSAQEFLEHDAPEVPGCVVLDVRLRGMSGLDLQDILRERGNPLPIIVLTAYADVPMAVRALQSGAVHFIQKPFPEQELLDHIQRAIQLDLEHRNLSAEQQRVGEQAATLTPRERQVMKLVVEGMSNKMIAGTLGVSFKTVEAHRAKVMRKMEAKSISHLIHLNLMLPSENHNGQQRPPSSDSGN